MPKYGEGIGRRSAAWPQRRLVDRWAAVRALTRRAVLANAQPTTTAASQAAGKQHAGGSSLTTEENPPVAEVGNRVKSIGTGVRREATIGRIAASGWRGPFW
jgi:hypothetical protein